jgi:hypothetical protein
VSPTTHPRTQLSLAVALAALSLSAATLAKPALGSTKARISAAFKPYRLGHAATIALGFRLIVPNRNVPPPLTAVDFHFPTDFTLATSELGMATCEPLPLEARGTKVCPANSFMGYGRARVAVPIAHEIQHETASIAVLAGPSTGGYVEPLITANGLSPVIERVVIPSILRPGELPLAIPLIQGIAGGKDVSILSVNITIGGNITYYETRHGQSIPFHPAGIGLPRTCPRGGFRFSAAFTFVTGAKTRARTTIPCPHD